jgi:type IV secretion system protein VirB9
MATYKKNLPNLLFLKPTIAGSDSNLTVITTRHTHYFHVISETSGINSPLPAPYAVKFSYPNDVRLQLQATLAEKRRHRTITANAKKGAAAKVYNYNYAFNGAPELRPVHVFDDGVFTYFELAPNQPIPAVFVVDNQKGEESVVNIRRKDALLVVHRTAPQFTLRLGKHQVASVFNNAQIASTSFRRHP